MSEKLKPCPFCGGEVSVVVLDEEGNVRDEEYERDPYSGLSYAVSHDDPNGACPIATYDDPLPWLYDSRDSVAHVWNRRAGRTCRVECYPPGYEDNLHYEVCSECGTILTASRPGERHAARACYCPHCGARVVDE